MCLFSKDLLQVIDDRLSQQTHQLLQKEDVEPNRRQFTGEVSENSAQKILVECIELMKTHLPLGIDLLYLR